MSKFKIIYRTSKSGYQKVKPHYINNKNCFLNAIKTFGDSLDWIVIADNCHEEEIEFIESYVDKRCIRKVFIGNGAGTFNLALDISLTYDEDDIVYFLENDYLHTENARKKILEAFSIGAEYVSLYDHPDKYVDGFNPYVEGGGEVTKVFLSESTHWKLTNSTTMTFASKVKTLRADESILRKWTTGSHPHDFQMFIDLREKGRTLITPIPGCSTHGESQWLSPLINWKNYVDSNA